MSTAAPLTVTVFGAALCVGRGLGVVLAVVLGVALGFAEAVRLGVGDVDGFGLAEPVGTD
ncbi:MAG TPA: hypothetical protein VGD71_43125 [Kribbella sp.]